VPPHPHIQIIAFFQCRKAVARPSAAEDLGRPTMHGREKLAGCFIVSLSTPQQNKVAVELARHSRVLQAGIPKASWMPAFAGMMRRNWALICLLPY
jgi:hypothetical protein